MVAIGWYLRRRGSLQAKLFLAGTILLMLLTIIGVFVSVQTVFQLGAGIALPPGVIAGKTASFAILALFALWLVIRLFRSISSLRARVIF